MVSLQPILVPTSGIQHFEDMSQVYLNRIPLGPGRLYISDAHISWVNHLDHGFELEHRHISMYSIPKKNSTLDFSRSLYIQSLLESKPHFYLIVEDWPTPPLDEDVEDDVDILTEIHFIPVNEKSLGDIYDTISKCRRKLIPKMPSVGRKR